MSNVASPSLQFVGGVECVVLTNPRIVQFYKDYPSINATEMNLGIINWLETIHQDAHTHTKDKVMSEGGVVNAILATATDVTNIQSDVAEIGRRLQTMKQEYIQDINTILTNSTLTTNDKLTSAIDRNSVQLVDRTTALLSENIPKQQDAFRTQIGALFKDLATTLVSTLTEQASKQSTTDILAAVDKRYTDTMQEALHQLESRFNQNLSEVKAESIKVAVTQDRLATNVDEFMAKYGNSSNKGKIGEANLAAVLTKLYPSAECINTTGSANSGDFRLVRGGDRPPILLENKDYIQNIDKVEVAKFIDDIAATHLSGVFLSQSSGISFKNNFQIDFHGGRVLVYVHNCGYCPEKIRAAIDIIDALEPKLKEAADTGVDHLITGEDLDEINREYQMFLSQKEAMVNTVKDNAKKLTRQIEEMRLPELERYLRGKYAQVKSRIFSCELCGLFHGNTKQSLAAHMRCCKRKETNANTNTNTNTK